MRRSGGMFEFDNWYIQFHQSWTEWIFGQYNWKTFTFIHIEYEDETCTANRSIVVYFLGIGFHIQWSTGKNAPALDMAQERMAQILAHPECAVEMEEFLNPKGPHDAPSEGKTST
jgi:hypothetical protein